MAIGTLKHVTAFGIAMGLFFSGCSRQTKKVSKHVQVGQAFFNVPILEEIREFSASNSDTITTEYTFPVVRNTESYPDAEPQQLSIDSDEFQAKLIDIPIPFGARLKEHFYDSEYKFMRLTYHCDSSHDTIVMLYHHEMERLGWSLFAHCPGNETVLIFNKPSKFCTSIVRSIIPLTKNAYKNTVELVIITGSKLS